jgi:hypothetical protein
MDKVSFGHEQVDPAEKTQRVRGVFSSVASRYDLMNDLMSGGQHRLWKDAFVRRVRPRTGEKILDLAGGTGDVAFRMARRGAKVTVTDINPDMLEVGIERAGRRGIEGLVWQEENAESLSFPTGASKPSPSPSASATSPMSIGPWRAASAEPAALLLPGILADTLAGLSREPMRYSRTRAADRPPRRRRRGQLSLPHRIDRAISGHGGLCRHDREGGAPEREGRADPRRPRRHPQRLEDLTMVVAVTPTARRSSAPA